MMTICGIFFRGMRLIKHTDLDLPEDEKGDECYNMGILEKSKTVKTRVRLDTKTK